MVRFTSDESEEVDFCRHSDDKIGLPWLTILVTGRLLWVYNMEKTARSFSSCLIELFSLSSLRYTMSWLFQIVTILCDCNFAEKRRVNKVNKYKTVLREGSNRSNSLKLSLTEYCE